MGGPGPESTCRVSGGWSSDCCLTPTCHTPPGPRGGAAGVQEPQCPRPCLWAGSKVDPTFTSWLVRTRSREPGWRGRRGLWPPALRARAGEEPASPAAARPGVEGPQPLLSRGLAVSVWLAANSDQTEDSITWFGGLFDISNLVSLLDLEDIFRQFRRASMM